MHSSGDSDALMAVYRLDTYPYIRRLPSHGRSPFRSCLRLVLLSYELFIWYTNSHKKIGTKHRGLVLVGRTPQTHAHVGRTCTEAASARVQIEDFFYAAAR